GDGQIESAVTIVVGESAASVPALAVSAHARFVSYIRERAIPIVVIKNVLAKVACEEILKAVIVVIANADALSPAGVGYAGLHGNVCECAVAIILEEMRRRPLATGEPFPARSIHKAHIQPPIVS